MGCRGYTAPSCTTSLTIYIHMLWPALSFNSVRQCAWWCMTVCAVAVCGSAVVCGSAAACGSAAVCGSAAAHGIVRTAVCGDACISVWRCALRILYYVYIYCERCCAGGSSLASTAHT
jgi:hypothetical protein